MSIDLKERSLKSSLEGIRVVDFGWAVAGPVAGHLIADMGAEVIKVESSRRLDGLRLGRPIVGDDISGGDEGGWPDLQPLFHAYNRGKLSITLDFTRPEGAALVKKLVGKSDVVIENFSPRVLETYGLSYACLQEVNQKIIMVSMSGAGQDGPLRNIVTYAPAVSALSGLSSILGYHGERLLGVGEPAFADRNASLFAALAVLAALHYRNRTGQGQFIDLSQWETTIGLVGEAIMDYVMNNRVMKPQGNRDAAMAPHGNYPCKGKDEWISIAVRTENEWIGLCKAMGDPKWTKEARFSCRFERLKNREALDEAIAEWTKGFDAYTLMEMLQSRKVAAVPVMNIENQFTDPHFIDREIYVNVEHPKVGAEIIYGLSWKMSKTPGGVRRPAPLLGQHNTYVLREILELSEEEIASLSESGILT
jgi:crotonobetainyl-CoA:carnitine CoA-transferase CaiB-like acyl-CoA transferase